MAGEDRGKLDGLDVALAALVLVAASALAGIALAIVPRFATMFHDFGAVLPLVTRLMMAPGYWLASLLIVLALGAGGIAARLRGARGLGIGLLAAGALLGLGAAAFSIYALYAPIFDLAGKIKP